MNDGQINRQSKTDTFEAQQPMLTVCYVSVIYVDKNIIRLSRFSEIASIPTIRDVGFTKFLQTETFVKNLFNNHLFNRIY